MRFNRTPVIGIGRDRGFLLSRTSSIDVTETRELGCYITQRALMPVWSKYWSEASISSIENLIALITVPVPHRRPG